MGYRAAPVQECSMSHNPESSSPQRDLRDWFAGQALVGLIPTPRAPGVLPMTIDGMAEAAYKYADAMLRARTK
jgi:hypothetical protein